MSKHRQLLYGVPVPQDFLDALQEFIGAMGSTNLALTMVPGSANQVQIVAGSASAQVSLGIDGLWRYISATTTTTVTGAAGTYDIFVTTGNNSFATNPTPPPPEIDSTDYTFALSTPLIQGNTPGALHYRKVGEAVFDGTRVISLRQTLGADGAQLAQPGDVKMSAVANPPAGWLACQGQEVSRTTYSALFAALGGTSSPWGLGAGGVGGATFNVPDLRGRAPIGVGQGAGLSARTLGAVGGEESHLSLAAEAATNGNAVVGTVSNDHTHGVSIQSGGQSADHSHGFTDYYSWARQDFPRGTGANVAAPSWGSTPLIGQGSGTAGSSGDHSHGVNGNTGGISANHTHALTARNADTAHNNMAPYAALTYLIKT